MADINEVARQFTDFYYQTFDSNRAGLQSLYRDSSMLTWENTPIMGVTGIMEKLSTLPFAQVQHKVLTLDAQPSVAGSTSILVLVTGQLMVDDGQNVLQYSQMFHLVPEGAAYFVQNDVFRLVYG
ncbi:nuclear transport factor 2 [Naematelia encephala]|uniref:Nuclear transport factor 2 n=1 Tax=Naematelia encephala TaxID=71784 RepID=A0A1Y2B600_9TREE|nr:nuclear transport factor 2 [Naematelia encephala]